MPYPSGISVLLRILTATVLIIFILYILISCEKQKRANGIVQNNEFCGLYVGYYEKRTSRSATKTKYNEMVKNVINEWKEIRDKREIYEISDEEYLD